MRDGRAFERTHRSSAWAALLLMLALPATARAVTGDVEPNNSFGAANGLLNPGITSVNGAIAGPVPVDTVLGAFDETNLLLAANDNQANLPAGDGRASGLSGIDVNSDGSVRLRVSGNPDLNFDGIADSPPGSVPHSRSGPFTLHVRYFDEDDALVLEATATGQLQPGTVVPYVFNAPGAAVFFDAYIDNAVPGADRIDFLTFRGLPAGQPFTATASSGFDLALGQFSGPNVLIADAFDDDGEPPFSAVLHGTVPSNGEATIALSSFEDTDFKGDHPDSGSYNLVLSAGSTAVPTLPPWDGLGLGGLLLTIAAAAARRAASRGSGR